MNALVREFRIGIDETEARHFLSLLDHPDTSFTFLAYPEVETTDGLVPWQQHGSFDEHAASLNELNRQGCAISVAVNETDGKGRRIENIKRIRAVWEEDDDGYSGTFPLEPSIVVETSPDRFHRYWVVADEWPFDEQGRNDFAAVMQSMVSNYGSDRSATDASRVLRLPGSYHLKGKPHQVRIKEASGRRYTKEEILRAFAPDRDASETEEGDCAVSFASAGGEEKERILDALGVIPAVDRETWLKAGMALHHEFGGAAEGRQIWDNWSKTCRDKYDGRDQIRTWNGFRESQSNPVTIATLFQLAAESREEAAITANAAQSDIPETRAFGRAPDADDLADRTMIAVRERFKSYGHSPSEEMYAGLEQIALALQAMADSDRDDGSLEANFLVSFLPPGTGKTTVLIEAVKRICDMPQYEDVGVIIFLERLEEIRTLTKEMDLSEDDYSVVVSEGKAENKLGRQDEKTLARVLFTTQKGLEYRGKDGKAFRGMTALHYNGKPRKVRVWDETILPAASLTLERRSINRLPLVFAKHGREDIAKIIDEFANSLLTIEDQSLVLITDLEPLGLDLENARYLFDDADDKNTVEVLWKLSGKTVKVRQEPMKGNTALDYENILPPDLAPMLILDASGRHRETYQDWFKHRRGLEFLKSAKKRYDGLTIHHWDRGSGRKAHYKDGKKIADGVAKLINNEIPRDEEVLIIHFLKSKYIPDMKALITERMQRQEGVYFCNWGRHTATNDYARCKHVILAGILQYPLTHNEAIGRGAKRIRAEDDFSDADLRKTRLGEIAHNVFQAACRGNVRRLEGDSCPAECHLYAVFSSDPGKGIPRELLSRIFPEANIVDWEPLPKALKGNKLKVAELLINEPKSTDSEIRDRTGISNLSYISRLRNDKDVIRAVTESAKEIDILPF